MSWTAIPWMEWAILAPLLGGAASGFVRRPAVAGGIALAFTLVSLCASLLAWLALPTMPEWHLFPAWSGRPLFIVDRLNAPLLVLVSLLHALTVLMTARVNLNRRKFTGHLIGDAIRLAAFACLEPWPLIVLLALESVTPYIEMAGRGGSSRVFALHMLLYVALLTAGQAAVEAGREIGPALLLAAVLVRCGSFPTHLWVPDLFAHATFGTALLFTVPMAGMVAALRLALPAASETAFHGLEWLAAGTALYAGGLAVVQTEARRFFAYLFISQAAMVLASLEPHDAIALTGSLYLWMSVGLSLGGLGLVLRALEARHGRLTLNAHRGLYDQSPALAVGFLLMGLGSVGFPGTPAFVAVEMMIDEAVEAHLTIAIMLVVAGALNGIAILRVHFLLFTGTKLAPTIPLGITWRERVAVWILAALTLLGGLLPQYGVEDRRAAAARLIEMRDAAK